MSTGAGEEQERGREADVPSEIPGTGWRDILLRLKDAIREDRITLIAAGVAFYGMLALFPAMIVVVSIYGLAMVVIVALPVAARWLPGPVGLLVSVLRWPLLAAVLIVGLAVLYRVAPSR